MDFSWSAEQLAIKQGTIEFAREKLGGDVIGRDRDATFPRALWDECARFGLQGLPFPRELGGQEADILTTMLAMEGLGYGCKDSGLIFALNAQMWSVQMPIWRFGNDQQKRRYLPGLCRGEQIGAHGMTEPDSGSDAYSLSTTATLRGDRYLLSGTKTFVSNAPVADLFVVFATIDKKLSFFGVTGFILERGFPGLRVSREIEKMGLRTSPMAELVLEECEVPVENRLGKEGQGPAIFADSMGWERSCILASYIGLMERQLETSLKHARVRKQFGKPIGKFQAVAGKIVDMKLRLETARLLLYKVAWSEGVKGASEIDAAMAKLYLSESLVQSCLDAVQLHGGYGYTTEYELERDLRDAIGSRIYSGTSEIQRNIIARCLGL